MSLTREWLTLMAEAAERRARLEARHRQVIAGARFVRVEHARIPATPPPTVAPVPPMEVRRPRFATPRSWDKPDGFEVAVFPPRGSRLFVPPHLWMSSERAWRRTEVP